MTNYKKEYRKWSLKERASPARGPPKYLPPEAPFDGQTIYQNDYIAKQPEICPVLQLHSNPDVICEGEVSLTIILICLSNFSVAQRSKNAPYILDPSRTAVACMLTDQIAWVRNQIKI